MDLYKFETLIVDLFAKMGYGKLQYESHVTRKPGDDGIDGIVTADKLGFDSIYIQENLIMILLLEDWIYRNL